MKISPNRLFIALFTVSLVLLMSGCAGSKKSYKEYYAEEKQKRADRCKRKLSVDLSRVDGGNVESQMGLAIAYKEGRCVSQDYKKAMKWFLKADQQGHAKAPYAIGKLYFYGNGVPQDMKEAEKWFRKGFKRGDSEAAFELGVIEAKNKNYPEAFKLFQKAVAGGKIYGKYNLGVSYYYGLGVKQNFVEAERALLAFAALSGPYQNKPDANYLLGKIYENGRVGPRDLKKAMQRYQKAGTKHAQAKAAVERLKVAMEWSRDKFITLFPLPQPGWTAEKLDIKELPIMGFEKFAAAVGGKNLAPNVRLRVKRRYQLKDKWMDMLIDTYDADNAVGIRLMFEKQEFRDEMAKKGARPLMIKNFQTISVEAKSDRGLMVKVAKSGILAVTCQYQDCDKDAEIFVKSLDLEKIARFAKHPHQKSE